jgi:hypothetical protein
MNACRARASVRNPKSMESKVRLSTKWGSDRQYTSQQVDCYPSLPKGRMPLIWHRRGVLACGQPPKAGILPPALTSACPAAPEWAACLSASSALIPRPPIRLKAVLWNPAEQKPCPDTRTTRRVPRRSPPGKNRAALVDNASAAVL